MKRSDRKNLSRNKHLQAPRADFHDYCAPGYYFITITAHDGTPPLSKIIDPGNDLIRTGNMIFPDNTPLGDRVQAALKTMTDKEPRLLIRIYVIMPDHIHFVLQVTDRLDKPIGKHIAPFSMACSKAYTSLFNLPEFTTLFRPFDDKIIFNYEQLDRSIQYVVDNPRRLLIRRRHPDLFQRNLHIVIAGHVYAAFGNMFLLKRPYLFPVRIHRKWSQAEFDRYSEHCRVEIAKGAIPISPAIHKVEKEIVRVAIDNGSGVIILRDLSFGERFKPSGEHFELCKEGRLLYLCPWPDNIARRSEAGSDEFHQMNDFAATIASLPATDRLAIRIEKDS